MTKINGRELNMLKTFTCSTRFWRFLPDTAASLWDKGLIKPTKFGMGNFQITDEGRQYLKSLEG